VGVQVAAEILSITSKPIYRAANSGQPEVHLFVTACPGISMALVIKGISGHMVDQPFELGHLAFSIQAAP